MKKYEFLVVLKGMQKNVYAFDKEQAVILAQVEAISHGLNYDLVSVTKIIR